MLNDKGRTGLRHLPPSRKWPSFTSGLVYLPSARIAGGWGAGWTAWHPWELLSFTLDGETATVRSLADSRITRTINRRQLQAFEEAQETATIPSRDHRSRLRRPTEIAA